MTLKTQSILTLTLAASTTAAALAVPSHPDEIKFPPLDFKVPKAADYRHQLSNGVTVYMAPSREFPLINLSFTFKGGAYLEPADKIGLARATGTMIRRGGAATVAPADLDEQFDFLAANAMTSSGATSSGASLNCLASNFDEAFGLFMDMLRNPGFNQDRLAIYKAEVIEGMKQRNDNASSILRREWNRVMFGDDHFESTDPTKDMVDSFSVEDLRAMHGKIFHPAPGHLFIAVTGDFEPRAMLSKLETALSGWAPGPVAADPPAPTHVLAPGLYHVEKDIPQGKVLIGERGILRDDPDYHAVMVMNNILGGGAFTSRITNRVRSDEGLAYSAGSSMSPGVWYPGDFTAQFDSKNRTVALATKIILEEISRITTEPVTQTELDTAKNSFIERFPRTFESKPAMLGVFVGDEMTRRPAGYWDNYRDNVRAVTVADIQRVARKHLTPDKMAILVVGKWDEIYGGDLEGRATMAEFFGGNVQHLPLRDPLTLEPMNK